MTRTPAELERVGGGEVVATDGGGEGCVRDERVHQASVYHRRTAAEFGKGFETKLT